MTPRSQAATGWPPSAAAPCLVTAVVGYRSGASGFRLRNQRRVVGVDQNAGSTG
jgi:hypothetical protein